MLTGGRMFSAKKCPCCSVPLRKMLSYCVLAISGVLAITLIQPSRNVLLYPVWPNAWRDISTVNIVRMKLPFSSCRIDESKLAKHCEARSSPRVQLSDVDASKLSRSPDMSAVTLVDPGHASFLPSITDSDRLHLVYLYLVVAETLSKAGVEFFMVEGTLLGVHRHQGLIPWDDDLDLAVNVTQASLVWERLSCIEGFELKISENTHWKFVSSRNESRRGYPFVDLFFYTESSEYIWAITPYITTTVVFTKKDTFPLTTGTFEGITVPIPKNSDKILRRLFRYDYCRSMDKSHKTSVKAKVKDIPCKELLYLYKMHYL